MYYIRYIKYESTQRRSVRNYQAFGIQVSQSYGCWVTKKALTYLRPLISNGASGAQSEEGELTVFIPKLNLQEPAPQDEAQRQIGV